MPNSNYY